MYIKDVIKMNSTYYNNLIKEVLDNSESNDWEEAINEWEIEDVIEDNSLQSSCICGKENLHYLFTIKNSVNGNTLYPIGSSCIKKFKQSHLNKEVSIKEQLFKLLHALEENKFIELSSEYFSRNLLEYLFDKGAFKSTKWNKYNPKNDYEFMLAMFNKRKPLTSKQQGKVNAIILNSIRPYLKEYLTNKIVKS